MEPARIELDIEYLRALLNYFSEISDLGISLHIYNNCHAHSDFKNKTFCSIISNEFCNIISNEFCGGECGEMLPEEEGLRICRAGLVYKVYPINLYGDTIGVVSIGQRRVIQLERQSKSCLERLFDLYGKICMKGIFF